MEAPLDMISLSLCSVTAVGLWVCRRRVQSSSVRMACVVAAVTIVPLRLSLFLVSLGVSHDLVKDIQAILGVVCNSSMAWIFVMEPPIGDGRGLLGRVHTFLHDAATKLDPKSQAGGMSCSSTPSELEAEPWNMQHFLP